jgi:hypothetical protein
MLPARFDTMPSRPSSQALAKTIAPSASIASLNWMASPRPTSRESAARRSSSGRRRRSSPSSARRSKATSGAHQALARRRNEKFAALAYIRPMIRPLPLIAGSLGVVFFFAAVMYSLVPAGDLPSFFPGFEAGGAHIHVKHAIGSLVIALVLFAFAWFQISRKDL